MEGKILDKEKINEKLLEEVESLKKQVSSLKSEINDQKLNDHVSLIVFSGDFDKAIAAFTLATGAAAMGQDVTMFFTYWGLNIIKKERRYKGKSLFQKMATWMMPGNTKDLKPSQMAYGPLGAKMFRHMMKGKAESLEALLELAQELDIKMAACTQSMEVLGIKREELIDPTMDLIGVAAYYEEALKSKNSYFI